MTLASIALPEALKLETLRRLDTHRDWQSLDEIRYCLVCGKLITGRQIQIIDDASDAVSVRLVCPTEGCASIPMDWVLPTSELLAASGNGSNQSLAPGRELRL